ncbi:protein KIBRA-like isoform X1 [Ptychodera flava]|uniref:protein KIBRA-like isoform X1 n=1 Tax=Ptychodera flava TaxID=63121 RepID=UPI00396A0C78
MVVYYLQVLPQRLTKPQSFADCVGNELPFGWEEVFDGHLGLYYVDHISQRNQIDDPRQEWRQAQEKMLKEYLHTAKDDLHDKQEIYAVKQQRLALAQDEFQHLNSALNGWQSRSSLCSSGSSGSTTKYDPELLKQEVTAAKQRVAKLKNELEQVKTEVHYKERGVATLQNVDKKMSSSQSNYKLSDAQAILAEIHSIQKDISSGEKEKADLMMTIGRLKTSFSSNTSISAPDISISMTSLSSIAKEKKTTSSQTELTGDFPSSGARLAEKAKLKLQNEEARRRKCLLQIQLAEIENKELPGQHEADKDRILLIQEKEQLLKELRKINPRKRTEGEMKTLEAEKNRLVREISEAKNMSHKLIGDRLKIEEKKKECLQQLSETTQLITYLENQLKSMSTSTLSISSSSSRGSLSAASSRGSLASSKGSLNVSFTDIYGLPHTQTTTDMEIRELKEKVDALLQGSAGMSSLTIRATNISPIHETSGAETSESSNASLGPTSNKLNANGTPKSLTSLSPRSSLSSLSPPASPGVNTGGATLPEAPPPTYQEHFMNLEKQRAQLEGSVPQLHSDSNDSTPVSGAGLTPASAAHHQVPSYHQQQQMFDVHSRAVQQGLARLNLESKSNNVDYTLDYANQPLSPISEGMPGVVSVGSQSNGNTRSVSAAISDESVAGDSGVYEAAIKRPGEVGDEVFFSDPDIQQLEAAQIQICLKYETSDSLLHISVEQARNLNVLPIPDKAKVYIKTALYPASTNSAFSTKPCEDNSAAVFDETFKVPLASSQLNNKTIQVNVWSVNESKEEDCLGGVQVSLANFNAASPCRQWYNILNYKYLQTESRKCSGHTSLSDSPNSISSNTILSNDRVVELLEASSSRLRRASMGERGSEEQIALDIQDGSDSRFRSSSFDTSLFRQQQQQQQQQQQHQYVPIYQQIAVPPTLTEEQQHHLYLQLQQQQQLQHQQLQQQLYQEHQQQQQQQQQQLYTEQQQQQLFADQLAQNHPHHPQQQPQQQQPPYPGQFQQQLYSEQLQQQQLYQGQLQQQLYTEQLQQQQLYNEHLQQQQQLYQLQQQQQQQHALPPRFVVGEGSASPASGYSALMNIYEHGNIQRNHMSEQELSQIWLCDKETNTDELKGGEFMRGGKLARPKDTGRGNLRASNIVRSATFSPGPQKQQYTCRLNRSDSDSSMPLYRRGPFVRNSIERKSLRWKKGIKIPQLHVENVPQRTSLDLELDLQASRMKHTYLQEEIARLKEIRLGMEEARAQGEKPVWLSDNDILGRLLENAEASVFREKERLQDRNDRSLRKASKEIYKLRQSKNQQPEVMSFREKMAFFTTVNVNIPSLPKNDY